VQQEFGTAIILITHDLGVIAEVADEVIVMYGGRAMEVAPRRALFREPSHPYTRGLLHAIPRADLAGGRLTPIPGQPPSLIARAPGCPFQPRCAESLDRCAHDTPPLDVLPGAVHHLSSCWLTAGNA
jgi:oligopeptide/dipeptide ABC transporter ATP-binding protein